MTSPQSPVSQSDRLAAAVERHAELYSVEAEPIMAALNGFPEANPLDTADRIIGVVALADVVSKGLTSGRITFDAATTMLSRVGDGLARSISPAEWRQVAEGGAAVVGALRNRLLAACTTVLGHSNAGAEQAQVSAKVLNAVMRLDGADLHPLRAANGALPNLASLK